MKLLADKTDVRAIADKVDTLKASVDVNTLDIVGVKKTQEEEKIRVDRRIADLELTVQQLSEGNSSSFFDKNQFQREKYNLCTRSLRLWPVPMVLMTWIMIAVSPR